MHRSWCDLGTDGRALTPGGVRNGFREQVVLGAALAVRGALVVTDLGPLVVAGLEAGRG